MKLMEIKSCSLFEQVKEYTGDYEDEDEEQKYILENIKRDCEPFIKAGAPLLWRGLTLPSSMVRNLSPAFHIGSVRNNREPKDSSRDLHNTANEYFKRKVGVPVRSTSLFVTGYKLDASIYGDTYSILPIGEFHYVWSSMVGDFTSEFQENFPNVIDLELRKLIKIEAEKLNISIENIHDTKLYYALRKNLFDNQGDNIFKFDENLNDAVQSYNEIMIVCDKYYILDHEVNTKVDEIYKTLRSNT